MMRERCEEIFVFWQNRDRLTRVHIFVETHKLFIDLFFLLSCETKPRPQSILYWPIHYWPMKKDCTIRKGMHH